MSSLTALARVFIAVSFLVFGIQDLFYRSFVTRVAPEPPSWVPMHPALAILLGIALILAAAWILCAKQTPFAALPLGVFLLLSSLFLWVPRAAAGPAWGGLWTNAGKALALSAAAFLIAASSALSTAPVRQGFFALMPTVSRFFLAAFVILCGIQHFLFTPFVATLLPTWIPGHIFWTYFAGVALIAGGLGMVIPKTMRIAAFCTALMIFLWVILLHIPRALAHPHDSNETTAVFEAVAISSAAFLAAALTKRRRPV